MVVSDLLLRLVCLDISPLSSKRKKRKRRRSFIRMVSALDVGPFVKRGGKKVYGMIFLDGGPVFST